jgi:type III secretion protein HrpB1
MIQDIDVTRENGHALASAMLHAIGDNRLDEAEVWLENLRQLNDVGDDHRDVLMFRVLIAIQRGQAVDALCYLNGLDENHCPDLKALCMYFAQDPMWEGLATDLADNSPDEQIRHSMALLINRSPAVMYAS